jgi:alcohol dehydrogenase (NADP+)
MKTKTLLAAIILTLSFPLFAISHEAADNCCVFHQALGKYKDAPRCAGGNAKLGDQGAISCWGLAAMKPGDKLVPYHYALAPIGDYDVLIDILCAGICHSDIHAIDGEFSAPNDTSHFPYVAGHEIVGRVEAVGGKVTTRKVGEIVGVGCYKGMCGHCESCLAHEEQYCPQNMLTYDFGGGLATKVSVPEDLVFHMPEGIPLEKAAPLLCAGVTTYSAIKQENVQPGESCAVIGFGGLGHVAAKILLAKGAKVTVFDVNTSKAEAAKEMGVEFVDANNESLKWSMYGKFDLIISTVPVAYDLMPYINMLRPHGTLHNLGLPHEKQAFAVSMLNWGARKMTASIVGSIEDHREALEFCAKNKIYPEVEIIDADEVNEVMDKLRTSTGRFRYVIDMQKFAAQHE